MNSDAIAAMIKANVRGILDPVKRAQAAWQKKVDSHVAQLVADISNVPSDQALLVLVQRIAALEVDMEVLKLDRNRIHAETTKPQHDAGASVSKTDLRSL